MTFLSWGDHLDLLDGLGAYRDSWSAAATFEDFDFVVRERCSALVKEYRYEEFIAALDGEFTSRDDLFEQLRISALARTAAEAGLTDEGWHGCFVSERRNGDQVCSRDRYAAPSQWTAVDAMDQGPTLHHDPGTGLLYDAEHWYLPDERTEVWADPQVRDGFRDADGNLYVQGVLRADGAPDPHELHLDAGTNRWRRWNEADGEFEYHHEGDGVWERLRDDGLWCRWHGERFGWLAYDEPSGTWLDLTTPNPTWRTHDQVGSASLAPAAGDAEPAWDENWAMFHRIGPVGGHEFADALIPGEKASGCGGLWLSRDQVLARDSQEPAASTDKAARPAARAAAEAAVEAVFVADPGLREGLTDAEIESIIAGLAKSGSN